MQQEEKKKGDGGKMETIKIMNGFTDKEWNHLDRIERIELTLEDFGRMNVIQVFKNLRSLTLINVGITIIEGLDELSKLEELNLNENSITKLNGLKGIVNVKSIYISHNAIQKIEGLENLTKLETLWLCDNKIDAIQNLENLVNLRQLWLAANQISYLRTSLDRLKNLHDLNISGNKICSFKEALNLNRLPNLKVLAFYDPHFGDNPICNLCNYQTYVLYHLRNIYKLDTLIISEEQKSFAEGTFMKKKMYYNMRIKTMQRTFSTLCKLLKKGKKIKMDSLCEDISNLNIKLAQEADKERQQQLENKQEEYENQNDIYNSIKKKVYEYCNQSIHKLITELETGGNIRLEEGKASEKWYVSCVDLINSRFHSENMAQYGIKDIQIKRVVRIHNKFIRNKFEEKMESLVDVSNQSHKKSLEYLFYGVDPNFQSEIYNVIEEGFRGCQESKQIGLSAYTPLVNSILGADASRIQYILNGQDHKQKLNKSFIRRRLQYNNQNVIPPGVLLICKVLMIKSVPDSKYPYFNPEQPWSEMFQKQSIDGKQYQDEYTVYRQMENDPKHRLWFVLDNNLVLPEYFAEFEYVMKSPLQNKIADFGSALGVLEQEDDDFITPANINLQKENINDQYNQLADDLNTYQFENLEEYPTYELKAQDLDRSECASLKPALINYFKYCLSRSTLYELNPNLVGTPDLNEILKNQTQFLNLSNCCVQDITFVKGQFHTLILSYNKISTINGLNELPNLVRLDLSHNEISNLNGLQHLNSLEVLDLTHNNIQDIDQIALLKYNQSLKYLCVAFNPINEYKETRKEIVMILNTLQFLDHLPVTDEDKEKTTNQKQLITTAMLQTFSKVQMDWKQNIQSVMITHQKLSSMKGLEGLVQLRHLNLGHNKITQITSLQDSVLLEELNLEKNQIIQIQELDNMQYLKKLELGGNKISIIDGISNLINLMQLSLEDNAILNLKEFPDLKSLMEIYLGNNNITNQKEINNIKHLQKLIILDLSGNPFARDTNYRAYVLYIIPKLKVLDGISIEAQEQQMAKNLYTGRLTDEILYSRLQGQPANKITELCLQNCELRDFEDVFNAQQFPQLVELDLSHNLFTSTKMLGFLPQLKILILASNKIDTLLYPNDINSKKGLNGCQQLQILDISQNCLKEFNGLQYCLLKELKIMKCEKNEIVRVDYLENLKQLKELDLNQNKVRQFDPQSFAGSNPIRCLKIDGNGLKNFQNIQKLYKLLHLFANSNRINDLPDIEHLVPLTQLKELELVGNSLSRRPGYRQMVLRKLPTILYLDGRVYKLFYSYSRKLLQEERERLELVDRQAVLPTMQIQQQPNTKVPVKLSSINFDGIFSK
ncbi:unnamed protein product (macronuclear) [Paramecium tetraurelia]|uniref:U2A'/phosphoprotein 32 family A C-terminal domain-containing protein n=1 Tax=Paramecium tetraurelia TaxID=5888 RepID=A0BDW4_PARTE|nr:uncharacterized protein GSPATT00027761001 [Paramecium tetraurelia]CAK56731.1 unnamed protein product [Paramecium tetraurelia]|eukprot:XP_001424129.1 hypothetical protein (macronuclear) [Paramecium tetraurelia strain d4-2]